YNGDSVSFDESPDGTIWMTVNGKFWRITVPDGRLDAASHADNPAPELPIQLIEQPGALFSSVLLTKAQTLLVGSTRGLFQVNTADGTLRALTGSETSVDIIGEDPRGRVWLVELSPRLEGLYRQPSYGLWWWREGADSLHAIPCLPYGRYRFDHQGHLWAWKITDNIFRRWVPDKFLSGEAPDRTWVNDQPFGQNSFYFPTTITFDSSNNLWLATNGFGVLKVNFHRPGFHSYLPFTSQRIITEDPEGYLYLQTQPERRYGSPGFSQFRPAPWKMPDPETDLMNILAFDQQGNAWSNQDSTRLYRLGIPPRPDESYAWPALGLISCRNGKLLSVREEGLQQFDPVTAQSRLIPFDQPQQLPAAFRYSHFLYEDPTSTVWIFAFAGLIQATPEGDGYRFRYFENDPAVRSSLSNNTVLSVAADPLDPTRYLWVGTKGGGLNRLDRQTGDFRHYKTEQGLPDNVIYGILPDDRGHLWLSTNRGLCRFHVREETTRNFTAADGLQNNEFNQSSYLRTRDGHLIFGGVNGLTVFHPDSLRFNEQRPVTAITRVRINNQLTGFRALPGMEAPPPLLERTDDGALYLDLTHRENLVSLEFAALEFSNPAQNLYRYRLIRHRVLGRSQEGEWVDLGHNNTVQFANLRPGHYTFQVLGSNNDGAWSEQPAVLTFTIHPPWWATWWAYVGYGLLAMATVLLIYRTQLRQRLQLQEATRLKELDQFKNRFFTNITHEFRTPLTVILGITNQLWTNNDIQPARESAHKLNLIRRNGENLLRLINQLLDLAKLESDELRINYVQGDVLPYLRYIAESLHSLASVRNVLLQVKSDQTPIVMDYDPERLQQIVYNLLSNAIKFTPSGGQVVLQARSTTGAAADPRTPRLVLTVTDTGIGIPPEELPRIFDRFHQADHLAQAQAGGTGIGLALTRELIHAMGGEISVESQLGQGTVFTVQLPIRRQAPMASDPVVQSSTESTPAPGTPLPEDQARESRPQLLIIEDNPDVVEYLSFCLKADYALDFAYNGRAGIDTAVERVPDLIISDVMMPEKDGFEVCDTLKNDERTSHIPIVLLTARAGVEDRIAGLRRGADAYLAKPFHEEELLVTLEKLF
ncbi:MAG: response regulator, partial [Lewinella sp.]|nr:response regulator [Lewinella sp.]